LESAAAGAFCTKEVAPSALSVWPPLGGWSIHLVPRLVRVTTREHWIFQIQGLWEACIPVAPVLPLPSCEILSLGFLLASVLCSQNGTSLLGGLRGLVLTAVFIAGP
jgi:hypothetical protein